MTLRIANPAGEGVYQGSKWLKIQVFCDGEELQALFRELAPFWIFPLTGVVDGKPISQDRFIGEYSGWIEGLKKGILPTDKELKRLLACAFTDNEDALWLQDIGRGFLTKIGRPVVQVQAHFFTYSPLDGVFRPMSMGAESVFWGLQFSYPQIYQDAETMEFFEAVLGGLFRKIQLWSRERTRATPFLVGEKRINSPIRIGKNCLSWIGNHPQLVAQKIGVYAH